MATYSFHGLVLATSAIQALGRSSGVAAVAICRVSQQLWLSQSRPKKGTDLLGIYLEYPAHITLLVDCRAILYPIFEPVPVRKGLFFELLCKKPSFIIRFWN